MEDGDDSERDLDDEEHRHDHDEHQSRTIGVPKLLAFGFPVFLEEILSFKLRFAEGAEQEDVENDEGYTRDEVDEDDAEGEVHCVVFVHPGQQPTRRSLLANVLALTLPHDLHLQREIYVESIKTINGDSRL